MNASPSRGSFVWQDLMTPDPDAAIDFYGRVIGWTTSVWEGGGQPYRMWVAGDAAVGGVMSMPPGSEGSPAHWLAYISAPDTDATAARASELGGRVHLEPRDIPTVGRFSVLEDPQGASFAAFTSAEDDRSSPSGTGTYVWHELATTDPERAFDFYSTLFGWRKSDALDMGEAGTYQMFGTGEQPIGGIYRKPAEHPGPPAWVGYVDVDEITAAESRVQEAGGRILQPPTEIPGGGWILIAQDPQGAVFALHSRTREDAST